MKKDKKKLKSFIYYLKTFDTFVFIATTSTSLTFSVTGLGLIVKPISTGIACGLTLTNAVLYEIVVKK